MQTKIVIVYAKSGREHTRMAVRARDEFKCQDCGLVLFPDEARKLGKRLFDVHHLNGLCGKKSRGYDRLSDMDGLVTLCHKCHFNRPEHTINKPKAEDIRKVDREFHVNIREMKDTGSSFTEIGKKFGITRQRAHQIYHGKHH